MRSNLAAPLQTGAPVTTVQQTTTVLIKEEVGRSSDETDFYYTKERLRYILLIRNLGFLAVAVAIASLVLASIHLANHDLEFARILVAAACLFLLGSLFAVYWSLRAVRTFKASNDLFQPQVQEGLSRTVFIAGLLLAGLAAFVLTHLYVEAEYSPDYATAQHTSDAIWDAAYPGRTEAGLKSYFRKNFIIQSVFVGFFFFYFLLVARAAFNTLKFGNQAMSHLVFLGSFLLLLSALGVIFLADYAFEYSEYPQLRAHFPVWNIRGLYFVGIALTAVAITGFLVDHRSWRVGFFVLAFVLLVLMAILATFTGFAYRHTRQTYNYYKGIPEQDTCLARMNLVHSTDLENYGCPAKYISADNCDSPINKWEETSADPTGQAPRVDPVPTGTAPAQQTASPSQTATPVPAQQSPQAQAQNPPPAAPANQAQPEAPANQAQPAAPADQTQPAAPADQTQPAAPADQTQPAAPADQTQPAAPADQTQPAAPADQTQPAAPADQTQPAAPADQTQPAAPADQTQPATTTTTTPDQTTTTTTTPDQTTTTTTTPDQTTTTTNPTMFFMNAAEYSQPEYCLNPKCCGIQGQLYSKHLLQLAGFGLLATLSAALVSIGCYYFWYVTWVDTARDKRRDFIWLGLMGLSILVFIILFFALDRPYISEKTGDGPRQLLEMLFCGDGP